MNTPLQRRTGAGHSGGMTLIELMISMVLGLIVIGGVVSVVLANKQSYRTNEGLSQVQESARTAFELMARDVRQAGVNGCDNTGRMANVLKPPDPPGVLAWWQTWFGMRGYNEGEVDPAVTIGTAEADRLEGTDSIQVQGIVGTGLSVEDHDPSSAVLKINAETAEFADDDILIVCDFDHSAMFQVSNYNDENVTVVHATGQGVPENCSKGLGFPTICGGPATGNVYEYGPNSQVARMLAVDWYIGANTRADEGGRSLYRRRLGSGAIEAVEEIVAGVTDMQIRYRRDDSVGFVAANDPSIPGNWETVNAVEIELTVESTDRRVSTDPNVNTGRLQHKFTHIVTLRNRVP
jgi:type IV pilus assembly protein PilW